MRAAGVKAWTAAAALLVLTVAATAQAPQLGRSIHGVVLDALDQPLASAIVYVENMQTKVIHTVVTDDHGDYAFHRLQPNVNYEVYAAWKSHKSPVRTDSQYSSRQVIRLDLQIPVG
ncbi:MAG: carboxypeptidase-like regulatory domain-containing protein [Terriglobales bacterium]